MTEPRRVVAPLADCIFLREQVGEGKVSPAISSFPLFNLPIFVGQLSSTNRNAHVLESNAYSVRVRNNRAALLTADNSGIVDAMLATINHVV